jgi:hypothetical protein
VRNVDSQSRCSYVVEWAAAPEAPMIIPATKRYQSRFIFRRFIFAHLPLSLGLDWI